MSWRVIQVVAISSALCFSSCTENKILLEGLEYRDTPARSEANSKNNDELLGAGSGYFCPSGFLLSSAYKTCIRANEALGPFSETMLTLCSKKNTDASTCSKNLWPVALTKELRGTNECMPGTAMDPTIGVCAAGDHVYGPFPLDLLEVCNKATNNHSSCLTMRWSRKILTDAGVVPSTPPSPNDSDTPIEDSAAEANGTRITLWATFYNLPVAEHVASGLPLRSLQGNRLGPVLDRKHWCAAAMEGSVRIKIGPHAGQTYNYAGRSSDYRVNCTAYYKHRPSGEVKFRKALGRYGDGVLNYRLVPFRTIAVDPKKIPYGSAVYIPAAKGVLVKKTDGSSFKHDGYFFAGDTGGLIIGNHIDVFVSELTQSPFPFIKSKSSGTFSAYIIKDTAIVRKLRLMHMQ
jgi:3D (Asp-Asp-Asp) domain-containing protein